MAVDERGTRGKGGTGPGGTSETNKKIGTVDHSHRAGLAAAQTGVGGPPSFMGSGAGLKPRRHQGGGGATVRSGGVCGKKDYLGKASGDIVGRVGTSGRQITR